MKDFNEKYKAAVKIAAIDANKTVSDFAHSESKVVHGIYQAMKKRYPEGLKKAMKPFKFFDCDIEVTITTADGRKIVIK